MAALLNKCDSVFAELPRLQQQLRSNSHGTDLFDIETGIDHIITHEIGAQILEAIRDFLDTASSSNDYSGKVKNIDHTLTKSGKAVRACKKHIDEAVGAKTTKGDPEGNALEMWKDFAFSITQLSLLVPMKRIEVLELLGGVGATAPRPPFPDSASEAGPRRSSRLDSEAAPPLPTINHSGGPGSAFSINSFMRRVRGQDRDLSDKNTPAHARARSDYGPRKLVKKPASISSTPGTQSDPQIIHPARPTSCASSSSSSVGSASNKNGFVPSVLPPPYSQVTRRSVNDNKKDSDDKSDNANYQSMNDTLPQKSPASQYSPGTKTTPSFIQNPQNPPAIYATNVYFTNIPCNPYPFPQPQTWQQPFHPNPYPPQVPPRPYMAPPPMMAPPQHHQPVAYKSSMWSLRQRAATEVFDLLKPDATCFHGIRHFKGHAACPCCASNRCFG